ncbi:S-layer homology domain-containing protein [Anaerocolumna xylanovorans]|uniref:S-layer homology domain-containing protein n=1 Tax=Anaerocolumna xylanovorans DSM 12503 TaxID=1121345 RepID=A0A1M7YN10_9FIRM|nr:S-layer homology domain-containing protein [Anaerocolumna xylanovorans]SHO53977.1 S-layer homology domain-containing protein [Anaerocolumna xylanovorans DSM 12503]
MKKKMLCFIMAAVMSVMAVTTVTKGEVQAAADTDKKAETAAGFQYESGNIDISVKVMEMLGIISETAAGDQGEKKKVTREEFAKMLVQASSYAGKVSSGASSRIFTDVSPNSKYSGYIKLAVSKGWMSGYLGGKFKPKQPVTLEEAINGAVLLLGYSNADFEGNIADAKYSLYLDKDLNNNIGLKRSGALKRVDCKNLFYNILKAKSKEGTLYGEVFGFALNSRGEIDYDKKVNESLKGPIFVNSKWESLLPFKVNKTKLYKNKVLCDKADLKTGDILYYSTLLKTVWDFDSNGDIDYKTLLDNTKKGPFLLGSSWKEKLPFSTASASIYKNDKPAKVSDITSNDVLYYSKEAKTIWAYDEKGNMDYLGILNKYKKGPFIAKSNFSESLPQEVRGGKVYKNGELSDIGKITDYDVVYYSKELKTIWIYDTKVYGVYEGVKPNKVAPTEIVVAGNTYQIGSQAVGYDLSAQGSIKEGMRVVLLMGDDGTVAGIIPSETLQPVMAGYILKVGKHVSKDAAGKSDLNNYVRVVDTSGNEQEYDTKLTNLMEGDVVEIKYTSGEAVVSKAPSPVIRGQVNSDATRVSGMAIAANARIIDVTKGGYIRVSVKRLADMELGSINVLYCGVNKNNEITDLILSDATGDLFQYGILLTSVMTDQTDFIPGLGEYTQKIGNYTYDLYGTQYSYTAQGVSFSVATGAKGFLINNGEIKAFKELYRILVGSIEKNQVRAGEASYPISDKVAVYVYSNNKYYSAKLSDITTNQQEYHMEAFIDKINQEGGVIRVIVATKK